MALFSPFVVNQWDPDAGAFINAALINGTNEAFAINQLVEQLKGVGLWNKIIALYPFVGGTAFTHKFNLKNPQDTDAAYRLTFSGTPTHNANGITGNGTNAFYNTFFNPSTAYSTSDNASLGVYVRTAVSAAQTEIGCSAAAGASGFQINPRNATGNYTSRFFENTLNSVASTTSVGFWIIKRTATASYDKFNNTTKTNVANAATARANFNVYGLAINENGTAITFSTRNQALAFIGNAITDEDVTNFNNINRTFQQTLGRFV